MEATLQGLSQYEQQTMHSALGSIIRRTPITVGLDEPVHEALRIMAAHHIGSIIVADKQHGWPLGIFTLQDLLRRVALDTCDLQQPIAAVMTSGLITLRPEATAYQAASAMARNRVRHIIVVDGNDRLMGLVSQNDLFALQRVDVKEISREILESADIEALKLAGAGIRRLAERLLVQGVGAENLMQLISTLNDLLTHRIIEIALDEHDVPHVDWCWIALGSEGRFEQTLSTDQDNGIIFTAHSESEAQALRNRFLPFARTVNEMLDQCGFPLCKGNIMASNPQWCLSLDEWIRQFSDWIYNPDPEALLNASIFFDFRHLFGVEALADKLHEWLLRYAATSAIFLRLMTSNALQCQPPLGLIRDFVFDDSKDFPHTIDLKMFGSRPFVDAARIIALGNGIAHTNTAQRLRTAAEAMRMGRDDVRAMIDAFFYIQTLRMQHQLAPDDPAGKRNRVDPDKLNELDRHVLKESFKQARKLQQRLQMEHRL